ncbi:MAG TPA: hypothetical protein PKK33_09195, partial [Candidatus Cloacimonadota bacterium]|nr:hypothetical protein [Candidatus Cloacimonadota bacterium]
LGARGERVYGIAALDKQRIDQRIVKDPSDMITAAENVHFPQMYITVKPSEQKEETTGNAVDDAFDSAFNLEKQAVDETEFVTPEEEAAYVESVLGDLVNNQDQFGFRPSLVSSDGKALYGVVRNAQILLESVEGQGVLKGVGRHEVVHYILRHLVDPKDVKEILNSTRSAMRYQGYKGSISDQAAEEFLAEVARGTKKLNVIKDNYHTTLVQKFVNWFKQTVMRIKTHGELAQGFLNEINSGKYRDMAPIYNIGMKYESALAKEQEEFKYKRGDRSVLQLTKVFYGKVNFDNTKKMVAELLINFSAYNRNLNDPNITSARNSIEKVLDEIQKKNELNHGNEKFMNKPESETNLQDPNEIKERIIWRLSDRKNFESVIRVIIPEINWDEDAIDLLVKKGYGDSRDFDVRKSLSSILRLHIGSIPYFTWTMNKNGDMVKSSRFRYVRSSVLEKCLQEAVMNARVNNFRPGQEFIDGVFTELMSIAEKYQDAEGENETANTIFSFLDTFSRYHMNADEYTMNNNGSVSYGNKVSHYHLAFQFNTLVKNMLPANATQEDIKAFMESDKGRTLYEKHKASHAIMSALYSHFASLQRQNLAYTEATNKYTNNRKRTIWRIKRATNTDSDIIKNEYKAATNYLTPNGSYIKAFKKAIDGSNGFKYDTEGKGDILFHNEIMIEAKVNNDGVSYRYEFAEGVTAEQIRSLFMKVFRMNIENSVIRVMLGQTNIGSDVQASVMSKNELATMIGHMFATVAAVDDENALARVKIYLRDRAVDASMDIRDEDYDPMENFLDDGGLKGGFDENDEWKEPTEEEIKKYEIKLAEQKKEREEYLKRLSLPLLKSFDVEFGKIAQVREILYAKMNKGFTYGPGGSKHYTNVLGHYLSDLFGQKGGVKYPSDVATRRVIDQIESADNLDDCSLAVRGKDGKIMYNDPLLEYRNTFKVINITYDLGTTNNFKSNDIDEINKRDYYNQALNAWFADSVFKRTDAQNLNFYIENISDSNTVPVVTVNFGEKLVKVYYKDGQIVGLDSNQKLINDLMMPIFRHRLRESEVSIRKWKSVEVIQKLKRFENSNIPVFSLSSSERSKIDRIFSTSGKAKAFEEGIALLKDKVDQYSKSLTESQHKEFVSQLQEHGMIEN